MKVNLPPKVRLIVYVLFGVGQFVAAYLASKNYIGEAELKLFGQISGFVFAMAAVNVDVKG